MPFLFWLPMIVMSGLWSVAEENTKAFRGSDYEKPRL
jgi:hypothetical protein